MMKSKTIFALAGFALTATMAMSAQAEPPVHRECAAGSNLISVDKAADQTRARQVDTDGNKDLYVCEKTTNGKHHYTDNKKKKP